MDRRDMTRIILEGALNGIGFVIGSAILGWIVSLFYLHIAALLALAIIAVVLWLGLQGRRVVKARLERVKVEEIHSRSPFLNSRWSAPCPRSLQGGRRRGRHGQGGEGEYEVSNGKAVPDR
jgi:MFS family permease